MSISTSFCDLGNSYTSRPERQRLCEYACTDLNAAIAHPVIDEAGHSLDESTIEMLTKSRSWGKPIICPIGKEVLNTDRLIKNYLAQDLVEKLELEKSLHHHLTYLVYRNEVNDSEPIDEPPIEEKNHKICSKKISELSQEVKDLEETISRFKIQNENLRDMNHLRSRDIHDLSQEIKIAYKKLEHIRKNS